ncbi:MAG TPA: D-arabinono-1,4-lactone oxidase [Thermoleophilaceae bacterium]|nr:D-arabinono-1,4-lactone oxidase [Thermoleophilaceae bacterium]
MAELWTNWSRDQHCAPQAIERPSSEVDVVRVVERARRQGERVRVAGTGHSFSDIACTDDRMLSLERMDAILDSDRESGLARVQAGITIDKLAAGLAERGLALENQGDIDRQAIAGAIATATHGTGLRFPNLSARVEALRIVTAAGEAVEVSEATDPAGWRAARVSLGALGAVTELTLRCVPEFTIRRLDEPRPLGETLDRFDELVETNDHFELFVFPYTDVALVRESERTDAAPRPPGRAADFVRSTLVENVALEAGCRVGRAVPVAIPRLNRAFVRLASADRRLDRSHRVYAGRRAVRFTEMEYAIPRERCVTALGEALELIERRRLPVGFPLEVRVAAADDAFLSTAEGRETAYIAIHQFTGMEFEAYFRAVEVIMDRHEGRPHWGKRHYQSAATLAPRYPLWDEFQRVRGRMDPNGTFGNDYTDRVLGPVVAPG